MILCKSIAYPTKSVITADNTVYIVFLPIYILPIVYCFERSSFRCVDSIIVSRWSSIIDLTVPPRHASKTSVKLYRCVQPQRGIKKKQSISYYLELFTECRRTVVEISRTILFIGIWRKHQPGKKYWYTKLHAFTLHCKYIFSTTIRFNLSVELIENNSSFYKKQIFGLHLVYILQYMCVYVVCARARACVCIFLC